MMLRFCCWILAVCVCCFFSYCAKEQELQTLLVYEWVETQIYLEDQDTTIIIRPESPDEIFKIVSMYSNPGVFKFYKGSEFLAECQITDVSNDDCVPNVTNCSLEEYCFTNSCGYQLSYRLWNNYTIFYQFPFLDGNFETNCHSGSLFKTYYTFYVIEN